MNKRYIKWMDSLKLAWESRNPKIMGEICDNSIRYFETPFSKPLVNPSEVIKEWNNVPTQQKDIQFNYNILSESDDFLISNWTCTFTRTSDNSPETLDGIFVVKLNNQDLCTEFKQWWVVKSKML